MGTAKLRGTIKTLNLERGYGFITSDTGEDLFFHWSGLGEYTRLGDLREGQVVSFSEGPDARGPRAENVRAA